uniref:suppressor of tumorigenicity 14 protein homolog n=1 Tax=Myxine glutinosa TaxID=7769 RepID=UPI00358F6F1A
MDKDARNGRPISAGDEGQVFIMGGNNQSRRPIRRWTTKQIVSLVSVVSAIIVIIILTAVAVWYFGGYLQEKAEESHEGNDEKVARVFTGSVDILGMEFVPEYEIPSSVPFNQLSYEVHKKIKNAFAGSTALGSYYNLSAVTAFSQGSVRAYFMVMFQVKTSDLELLRSLLSVEIIGGLIAGDMQKSRAISRGVVVPSSLTIYSSDERTILLARSLCSKTIRATSSPVQFTSPGFQNDEYPANSQCQWFLRGSPGKQLRLNFQVFELEDDCSQDFVEVFDSLIPAKNKSISVKCGKQQPGTITLTSSSNILLLTFFTGDQHNFRGFKAKMTELPPSKCNLTLEAVEEEKNFTTPFFPSHYPPKTHCVWKIKAKASKRIRVVFYRFELEEPEEEDVCTKDYLEVLGTRYCGEQAIFAVRSVGETLEIVFHSDDFLTSRGFVAEFVAFDDANPCPRRFACGSGLCVPSIRRCDTWNDCGDNTDEINCKCQSEDFTCGNDRCVDSSKYCDGYDDCGDGSDEACDAGSKCTDKDFKCHDGDCVKKINPECDNQNDCSDNTDEENCDCGMRVYQPTRIVGGQDAEKGEFPWQVSLHLQEPHSSRAMHTCGASIISEHWLVSASHCFQEGGKDPKLWKAYVGLHSQTTLTVEEVARHNIKRIITHKSYNDWTYDYDIALLELETPLKYTYEIRPICLPAMTHNFPVGKSCMITGWGSTKERGAAANVLQKAAVDIINETLCKNLMEGSTTIRMLCAGFLEGGIDACQGDSGGPLVCVEITSGHWFLAGIVSWGEGCARANKPGLYTRVTSMRSWIYTNTDTEV